MQFRSTLTTALLAASLFTVQFAQAAEFGTAKEAEAMVGRAMAHLKAVGKDQAYSDFTEKKNGTWVDRDLYVVVQRHDGVTAAHAVNAKLVGKNMWDFKDASGREFARDIIANSKAKPASWTDYVWSDPVSKKILPKSMYCETAGDASICVGIYKR